MSLLDNNNYETYVSYTGTPEEIAKFKEITIDRGFFSFPAILPVPKELTEHPMIENACYNSLMLKALKLDPRVKYYGNIRDKMSQDTFYREIIVPYATSGINYRYYTEDEIIKIIFADERSTDSTLPHTIDEAISALIKKADDIEGENAYKRMKRYGCATRYSWRQDNWGAPMEATGCQIRPEAAKGGDHTEDAIMIYTSGGNGLKLLHFMAKKFSKIEFEIYWRRIDDESKIPEGCNLAGGHEHWWAGTMTEETVYEYHVKTYEAVASKVLDTTMDSLKKTFREGWDK